MSDPKQNLRDLRDLIAGLPAERFDMQMFAFNVKTGSEITQPARLNHTCGTAGCIAGWAVALKRSKGRKCSTPFPFYEAMAWLGLDDDGATALFSPIDYDDPGLYPKSAAVATLDHLIETGEVVWASKSEAA